MLVYLIRFMKYSHARMYDEVVMVYLICCMVSFYDETCDRFYDNLLDMVHDRVYGCA